MFVKSLFSFCTDWKFKTENLKKAKFSKLKFIEILLYYPS